jgi:hypothetical protein
MGVCRGPSWWIYIFRGKDGGEDPRAPPPLPRYISGPTITSPYLSFDLNRRHPSQWAPSGPLVTGGGAHPPPTDRIWVWRKIQAHRQLVRFGYGENHPPGAPRNTSPSTGEPSRPRRRAPLLSSLRPHPPPNRQLAGCPPGRGLAPHPSGLADRHPTAPPPPRLEGRCRTPSTPPRGEGTPARSRHRASRLARAVTSDRPIAPSPAAHDAPPQSTSQPGAAGPVASRLTIYSPTPVGGGNGQQALKSPKSFPGDALNYVSDPCTIFFPYKVGHPVSPVTQFKGLGQNSPNFT